MNIFASCLCCNACQPRYKRLVDSIYPANAGIGLVKANMQKLTFYSISHPEKLDRIGDYLSNRIARDIYRLRISYVRIGVDAIDSLMAACHGSPSPNLFVESFLRVIQKLLETQQPEFEIMATDSFIGFANIQEDTPSYHRRYDFFISKFSVLCHSSNLDPSTRLKLRGAGIKGLRGVVRKTVSDDLQANIWEKQHMEKIVPSLLFNMHDVADNADSKHVCIGDGVECQEETPSSLADACLRELIGKASFGNMKCVLQPVLNHFDYHHLWSSGYPPAFALSCFQAIMYSIQTQYSYVVIQLVINHLDMHSDDAAEIRLGIATVLSSIVLIAATASIGPTLLEIFNSMLRHLRQSVDLQFTSSDSLSDDSEKQYQETLINTMGDFANNLPDYQKVEIMMFIIGKVPYHTSGRESETFLQKVLVRTLLKVATKYRTGHLATVLTSTFLDPLLKLALNDDCSVRLLVQEILHTLFDRHSNLPAVCDIRGPGSLDELKLTVEKSSRTDAMFVRKNGHLIFSTLYKCALFPGNKLANYQALLATLLLICIEAGCEEEIVEAYRLVLALQSAAIDDSLSYLTQTSRIRLHNLVAKYMSVSAQLLAIPTLCQHVQQVLKARQDTNIDPRLNLEAEALRANPLQMGQEKSCDELSIDDNDSYVIHQLSPDYPVMPEACLFDKSVLIEALQLRGFDITPFSEQFAPRPLTGVFGDGVDVTTSSLDSFSAVDAGSASLETLSLESLNFDDTTRRNSRRNTVLGMRMHNGAPAPITVSMLRRLVNQPLEYWQKLEEERCKEITMMFRTLPFEQLVAKQRETCRDLGDAVEKIMKGVEEKRAARYGDKPDRQPKRKDFLEIKFPDLFVY